MTTLSPKHANLVAALHRNLRGRAMLRKPKIRCFSNTKPKIGNLKLWGCLLPLLGICLLLLLEMCPKLFGSFLLVFLSYFFVGLIVKLVTSLDSYLISLLVVFLYPILLPIVAPDNMFPLFSIFLWFGMVFLGCLVAEIVINIGCKIKRMDQYPPRSI